MEHPDPPSVARARIASTASLPILQVLLLTGDVQSIALELCEKYGTTRHHYYDAPLVTILVTENTQDFKDMKEIRAADPYGE